MKQLIAYALCAAALMGPGSALAQDEATPPAAGAAPAAGATAYDFEDDLVSGDLVRPDGELLSVRRRGNRESLIQIREHFIPEMLKSVEDL
ncbi:MAG: hypothetical protein JWN48_1754 [Myxococcaceae bacterium]|nr:hypothetical protein [Myxococcaceae bacterium]